MTLYCIWKSYIKRLSIHDFLTLSSLPFTFCSNSFILSIIIKLLTFIKDSWYGLGLRYIVLYILYDCFNNFINRNFFPLHKF